MMNGDSSCNSPLPKKSRKQLIELLNQAESFAASAAEERNGILSFLGWVDWTIESCILKELMAEDKINHPAHYNTGSIEVIDAIDSWELGFYEGNIIKYVARYKHKG